MNIVVIVILSVNIIFSFVAIWVLSYTTYDSLCQPPNVVVVDEEQHVELMTLNQALKKTQRKNTRIYFFRGTYETNPL